MVLEPHRIISQNTFVNSVCFYCKVCIYGAGTEPSPLVLWPFIGISYQPWMINGDDCGATSGTNAWQGKQKYYQLAGYC
jgi:hypothetical protein